MNQRIKELYKQSSNQDYFPRDTEEVYMSAKDLEKFAELIVRECGEVAYRAYWDNPETVKGIHIKEAIQKHFGVRE